MNFDQQALQLEEPNREARTSQLRMNKCSLIGTNEKKFWETCTCFKCDSVGHIRRSCLDEKPKRYPESTHGAKVGKTKSSDKEAESDSCVFTLSEGNIMTNSCNWLIDLGPSIK